MWHTGDCQNQLGEEKMHQCTKTQRNECVHCQHEEMTGYKSKCLKAGDEKVKARSGWEEGSLVYIFRKIVEYFFSNKTPLSVEWDNWCFNNSCIIQVASTVSRPLIKVSRPYSNTDSHSQVKGTAFWFSQMYKYSYLRVTRSLLLYF